MPTFCVCRFGFLKELLRCTAAATLFEPVDMVVHSSSVVSATNILSKQGMNSGPSACYHFSTKKGKPRSGREKVGVENHTL